MIVVVFGCGMAPTRVGSVAANIGASRSERHGSRWLRCGRETVREFCLTASPWLRPRTSDLPPSDSPPTRPPAHGVAIAASGMAGQPESDGGLTLRSTVQTGRSPSRMLGRSLARIAKHRTGARLDGSTNHRIQQGRTWRHCGRGTRKPKKEFPSRNMGSIRLIDTLSRTSSPRPGIRLRRPCCELLRCSAVRSQQHRDSVGSRPRVERDPDHHGERHRDEYADRSQHPTPEHRRQKHHRRRQVDSAPHASPGRRAQRPSFPGGQRRVSAPCGQHGAWSMGNRNSSRKPVLDLQVGELNEVAGVAGDEDQVVDFCDSGNPAVHVGWRASPRCQPCTLSGVPERGVAIVRKDGQRSTQHLIQVANQVSLSCPFRHLD